MPAQTILFPRFLTSGSDQGLFYPASSRNTESVYRDLQDSNFDPFSIITRFAIALGVRNEIYSESFFMMAATEHILMEDWNTPEEDEAWADLLRER